ncbi:MAG: hypothetical protein PHU34_11625 [Candidatus Methanoperedens sp.]|nr:hypothetical protein [Candidatus Methanoperedens sp.]
MWIGHKRKLIILSIGIASVLLAFSAPMYTSASKDSDYVRCDACHIQENDEFYHTRVHTTLQCTSCHNISDFASDLYSHNATTYECIYCHTEHNSTKFYTDAHNNFSNASNATNIFRGSNEMCVACHSGIDLVVEWHSYTGMNITSAIDSNGAWSLNYSSLHGENITTNYTNYTDYLNKT